MKKSRFTEEQMVKILREADRSSVAASRKRLAVEYDQTLQEINEADNLVHSPMTVNVNC